MRGDAEAFAVEAKGRAEAEQMAKKAEAFLQYKDGAMVDMLLEKLPLVGLTLMDESMGRITPPPPPRWPFVRPRFHKSCRYVGLIQMFSALFFQNPARSALIPPLLLALQMAEEISRPLMEAKKITMVSSGGAEVGASKLTGEVLDIMTRLPAAVEKLTGVRISQVSRRGKTTRESTTQAFAAAAGGGK